MREFRQICGQITAQSLKSRLENGPHLGDTGRPGPQMGQSLENMGQRHRNLILAEVSVNMTILLHSKRVRDRGSKSKRERERGRKSAWESECVSASNMETKTRPRMRVSKREGESEKGRGLWKELRVWSRRRYFSWQDNSL